MVIGIIGAGISGLAAGRLLARNGHEVTIIEKSRGFGGRMATRYAGENLETKLDHGLSFFSANSPEFQNFVAELMEQGLVKRWGDDFAFYNGEDLLEKNPNVPNEALFTATKGMNSIGKYLSRWVDVKTDTLAGGLTFIGSNRTRKRSWMINLTAGNTFEADAVILALPAPQAYGILNTTIDEVNALKLIREIDEIKYDPCFSLMAGYGDQEPPEWEGVISQHSSIRFISNEVTKKKKEQECSLVVQATPAFTREHYSKNKEEITKTLLEELGKIAGSWSATPDWTQLHYWRYSRAKNVLARPYMELEFHEAPLALVGDYFEGNTAGHAYRSGVRLAERWLEEYG